MARLIDVVLDALLRGDDVTVYELAIACEHPTHSPLTGYREGCRCDRCRAAALDSHRRYRVRHPEDAVRRNARRRAKRAALRWAAR